MFNVHCISFFNFVILKGFWRFKSSGRAAREDNLMRGKKLISPHGGLVPILAWVLPGSSLSWRAMVLVIKVEAWWQDEMMLKMKTVNWPLLNPMNQSLWYLWFSILIQFLALYVNVCVFKLKFGLCVKAFSLKLCFQKPTVTKSNKL